MPTFISQTSFDLLAQHIVTSMLDQDYGHSPWDTSGLGETIGTQGVLVHLRLRRYCPCHQIEGHSVMGSEEV